MTGHHTEDLRYGVCRGACGLSNYILDLGPFANFRTPVKPVQGGLDPSPIYHRKAQKLLHIHHISGLPDANLTCLRSDTYLSNTIDGR